MAATTSRRAQPTGLYVAPVRDRIEEGGITYTGLSCKRKEGTTGREGRRRPARLLSIGSRFALGQVLRRAHALSVIVIFHEARRTDHCGLS